MISSRSCILSGFRHSPLSSFTLAYCLALQLPMLASFPSHDGSTTGESPIASSSYMLRIAPETDLYFRLDRRKGNQQAFISSSSPSLALDEVCSICTLIWLWHLMYILMIGGCFMSDWTDSGSKCNKRSRVEIRNTRTTCAGWFDTASGNRYMPWILLIPG